MSPVEDLASMAGRLRAEWRADESEWMREAARRWAHGRRIADLFVDYAARGDRVCVEVAGCTFDGVVTAVGDDRIDLVTGAARVTVRTALDDAHRALAAPIVVRRSERARRGGRRTPPALVTFVARLREVEIDARPVRVGLLLPAREITGTVVVGADHVIVRGADDVVVPRAWVAYVVASSGSAS